MAISPFENVASRPSPTNDDESSWIFKQKNTIFTTLRLNHSHKYISIYHRKEYTEKNGPKNLLKKKNSPKLLKTPHKIILPNPVATSTCPALMTWSRSNSAHGTVTGTAKPYLGFNQKGDNQLMVTLPKINIAPENKPSQKEIHLPTIHFQVLC